MLEKGFYVQGLIFCGLACYVPAVSSNRAQEMLPNISEKCFEKGVEAATSRSGPTPFLAPLRTVSLEKEKQPLP
jgi:hypothetical protein